MARANEVAAELARLGGEGASWTEAAVLLLDRYPRIGVDSTSRLELPNHVAAHLGALAGGIVFVVRWSDHVQLWSETYRHSRLLEAVALAEGLP